jgi:6-phosphofructokinase
MKIAGLLTNGGDTCSLNALLRFARDALRDEGFVVLGFQGGYRGLITNTYRIITDAAIDPLSGGTFLLSLRDSPTPSPDDKKRMEEMSAYKRKKEEAKWKAKLEGALNTLKENHIDVLVVLGGNGTIAATADFIQHVPSEHRTICLPRTIDNDLNTHTLHLFEGKEIQTALCPGYPSAAEKIVRAVRGLRTTARSTRRIFTIETMGRDAGWLALAAALGWAEVVTVPEVNLVSDKGKNESNKKRMIGEGQELPEYEVVTNILCERVAEWYKSGECRNVIVAVSEGTMKDCERVTMRPLYGGKRKLGGAGDAVNELLTEYLKKTGALRRTVYPFVENPDSSCAITEEPEVRCQHTDYSPRMGEPSRYDVELARVLGYQRLRKMLQDEEFGRMPVLSMVLTAEQLKEDGLEFTKSVDFREARQMLLPVIPYYDLDRLTSTKAFDDFLYRIVGRGIASDFLQHSANG